MRWKGGTRRRRAARGKEPPENKGEAIQNKCAHLIQKLMFSFLAILIRKSDLGY